MNHFEIYSIGSSLWTKEEILDETLDSNHVLKDKKVSILYSMNFLDYIWWLWALTCTKTQRGKLNANTYHGMKQRTMSSKCIDNNVAQDVWEAWELS